MDLELPSTRGRSSPGMALAVATIVAAGVTGMAVAGLTWALERPAEQSTGAAPDLARFGPTPSSSASGPVETPGWADTLGLPVPEPLPSGGEPVVTEGVGTAAQPAAPGTEEATRRAAAARRPIAVGPKPAAAVTAAPASPAPVLPSEPAAIPSTDPDPDVVEPDPGFEDPGFEEPVATETTEPDRGGRDWEAPRSQWRDQPRQAPAPAPWSGPFGNFPAFPWG